VPPSTLVNVGSLPAARRPYDTQDLDIQPERLLYAPGGPFTQPVNPTNHRSSTIRVGGTLSTDNQSLVNAIRVTNNPVATDVSGVDRLRSQRRKAESYRKWADEIIPSLVGPYLSLLKHTISLQQAPDPLLMAEVPSCAHGHPRRQINVTLVYQDSEN
jgi:hypothetical protein